MWCLQKIQEDVSACGTPLLSTSHVYGFFRRSKLTTKKELLSPTQHVREVCAFLPCAKEHVNAFYDRERLFTIVDFGRANDKFVPRKSILLSTEAHQPDASRGSSPQNI